MINLDALPMSRKQLASIVSYQNYRTTIWSGAVRSGKSTSANVAFFHAVATAPEGQIIIVGRTLQTIERNIIDEMQNADKFGPLAHEVHHTRGSNTAVILGRTVWLIGASDVRAEGKIRGLTACLAMVDEATLLPENFWTQLGARLSVPGAHLLATTNPDNPAHYLKVNYIDRQHERGMRLKAWNFTLDDNPGLDDEYVESLKAENQGLFYLRNILGQWVAADGAVYDCFDPAKHVVPWAELPDMQFYVGIGVDHGTTNPTAATLLGLGMDNVLYAVDEWRYTPSNKEARKTNVQLSEGLRTWMAGAHHPSEDPEAPPRLRCYTFVDPAAADYRVQLKQDGLTTYPAQNNVLYGIRTVSALLSTGQLKISDRCPELLKELPGYVWDTKATDEGKDQPIKLNDHSADSLRYGISSTERKWRKYVKLASVSKTGDMAAAA
ncbi:PBSX family phage terminase large subunit [Nocardia africana]